MAMVQTDDGRTVWVPDHLAPQPLELNAGGTVNPIFGQVQPQPPPPPPPPPQQHLGMGGEQMPQVAQAQTPSVTGGQLPPDQMQPPAQTAQPQNAPDFIAASVENDPKAVS